MTTPYHWLTQYEIEARQNRSKLSRNSSTWHPYADILGFTEHRLIDKFLEITEREVSKIDKYWDENWDALEIEIQDLMIKIAKEEWDIEEIENIKAFFKWNKACLKWRYLLFMNFLRERFNDYHKQSKAKIGIKVDCSEMSWIEFETFIAGIFRNSWYDIAWTPTTWDQWADLIAKKDWKIIVIQAKRWQSNVWNWAVQEVIAAIWYYKWTEWWVITNSYFTNSAKALADIHNIKLIDWFDLKRLSELI